MRAYRRRADGKAGPFPGSPNGAADRPRRVAPAPRPPRVGGLCHRMRDPVARSVRTGRSFRPPFSRNTVPSRLIRLRPAGTDRIALRTGVH